MQPQPKCGFVVVGARGTLASYDCEATVRLQTEANPAGMDVPVDVIEPEERGPIAHVLHALGQGKKIGGPLSPKISRIAQQIVDCAVLSARLRKTVKFVD
jgi:glucose-fructose oxidoreductase